MSREVFTIRLEEKVKIKLQKIAKKKKWSLGFLIDQICTEYVTKK